MTSILIVEDDDEIRELLAEMLAECGYLVATARNGEEGLERLRTGSRPDVVLLDLMMPVMDGWQMRAAMLADAALRTIPVVIVSGAADLEDSVERLEAAAALTKPVKWPILLASVRTHAGAP